MKAFGTARLGCAAAIALACALGSVRPSMAMESVFPASFEFPAGLACTFDLRIKLRGGNQVSKTFFDKDGNSVRAISAGAGAAFTFTNRATGATLSLQSNGAATHVTSNPDGTQTWVATGHSILILLPTDVPAGPSTTLYEGRVVYTVSPSGVFTAHGESGNKIDICAALSSYRAVRIAHTGDGATSGR